MTTRTEGGSPAGRTRRGALGGLTPALLLGLALVGLGTPPTHAAEVLLSQGKSVTVSSTQSGLPAGNAVDGDPGTRWGSNWNNEDEWIVVDLGSVQPLTRVELVWEGAYASAFALQTANQFPTTSWTTLDRPTAFGGGTYRPPASRRRRR